MHPVTSYSAFCSLESMSFEVDGLGLDGGLHSTINYKKH